MKKQSRIAIAAARSGGHIIPGMTLAHHYCLQHLGTEIIFFSTDQAFDQKLLSEHTWPVHNISLSLDNVPKRWYQYPIFLGQCISSLAKSIYYLARLRPSHVILMGGYISIPVGIAALILRIPRELYELNAIPGSATKALAPLATTIHVCFPSAQSYFKPKKTVVSHYPLRFNKALLSNQNIKPLIGFDQARKTVLILGGSQGSVSLNKIVLNCLQENPALNLQSISFIKQAHKILYIGHLSIMIWVFPQSSLMYHHDLAPYYQAADIVIGRAGAGTIFETLFFSNHVF